jgi:hypothetical protein
VHAQPLPEPHHRRRRGGCGLHRGAGGGRGVRRRIGGFCRRSWELGNWERWCGPLIGDWTAEV